MKKVFFINLLFLSSVFLSGCTMVGDRSSSISVIYLVSALLSLALLGVAFWLLHNSEPWLILLFSSVFVVNGGYYLISVSKTLEAALWANRLSYLGSALLPIAMLMIILKTAKTKYKKWLPLVLFGIAFVVVLVAASPGISDMYYKEVSLGNYNGATVLEKVYGPWHPLYMFYLLGYTVVTAVIAVRTAVKKTLQTGIQTAVLFAAVFINIGVWLIEQFVKIDIELLAISYIISELFLLSLFLITRELEKEDLTASSVDSSREVPAVDTPGEADSERLAIFREGISRLTPAESTIYGFYIEGKSTKEIMASLCITENTLKYHNKNLYSKLGVSSRKQLIELAKHI